MQFFTKNKGLNVNGHVEEIKNNIKWLNNNYNHIKTFLNK
jgi:hypothetical protein